MSEHYQAKNEDLTRLSIRSKIFAGVILTGFVVFSTVVGLNVNKINKLENEIDTRNTAIEQLNDSIASLESNIYTLRYSPTDKITPRATANILPPEITENGNRIYDYTVWIDLSNYRLKTLTSVAYSTIGLDTSFEDRIATNEKNGFSITFRGTECVPEIKIDITFSDDTNETVIFKMCEALASSQL